jgi:hypothetical protein
MKNYLRSAVLVALSAALIACGGATPSPTPSSSASGSDRSGCTDVWPAAGQASSTGPLPLLANSDLAPGANRLILGLVDGASFPLGSSAWSLKSEVFDITNDGCTPLAAASPLPFTWAITDVRGFFIGSTEIPVGAREIGLVVSGTDATGATVLVRFTSFVRPKGTAPRPGDAAPTVATPLAATNPQGIAGVSTDPEPRAEFYTNSASELLAAGTPFLIAFASPAFCVSQACGPTLTLLKSAADQHPGVVIVHVEPYQMSWNGTRLIPVLAAGGGLQATSIVTAWQVPVEPWIFTVGRDGRILRSLEGVISPEEFDAALAELAAN